MQAAVLGVGGQRLAERLGRGVCLAGGYRVPSGALEKRRPGIDLRQRGRGEMPQQQGEQNGESDGTPSRLDGTWYGPPSVLGFGGRPR